MALPVASLGVDRHELTPSVAPGGSLLGVPRASPLLGGTSVKELKASTSISNGAAENATYHVSFKTTSAIPYVSEDPAETGVLSIAFPSNAHADACSAYTIVKIGEHASYDAGGCGNTAFAVPYAVAAGEKIEMTFTGIENPVAAGKYSVEAWTTTDETRVASEPFTITPETAVSEVKASTSISNGAAENATYHVSFKTTSAIPYVSEDPAETGVLSIAFPSNAHADTCSAYTIVKIGEHASYDAGGCGNTAFAVPYAVAAGEKIEMTFTGIENPVAAGKYSVEAWTTTDETRVASEPFTITPETAVSEVKASTSISNGAAENATYHVSFKTTSAIPYVSEDPAETGVLSIAFPSNAHADTCSAYTIVKIGEHASYDAGGCGNTAFAVPYAVAAGEKIEMTFTGIENPVAAGKYSVEAWTTTDETRVASEPFTITPETAVSEVKASTSISNGAAENATYHVSFKTTSAIPYVSEDPAETGVLSIAFPSNAHADTCSAYTIVKIGEHASYDAGGCGNTAFAVPYAVAAGEKIEMTFTGIENPVAAGKYSVEAWTTTDETRVASEPFTITPETAVSEVKASTSISNGAAENATYHVSFKTTSAIPYVSEDPAETGVLSIAFPSNAHADACSAYTIVKIGEHASYDAGGCGNTAFAVPYAVAAGEKIEMTFTGIENPVAAGKYSVEAWTTTDETRVASEPFTITPETAVSELVSHARSTGYVETFVADGPLHDSAESGGCCESWVHFVAPSGTSLPGAASDYQFLVGGTKAFEPVATNVNGNNATLYVDGPVASGASVRLEVSGVSKPPVGEVRVSTSSDVLEASAQTPLPPTLVLAPTIAGSAEVGDVLTVDHGVWAGEVSGYLEQWVRCSSTGTDCVPIEGADHDKYVVSPADDGHALEVEEVAVDANGESAPESSAPTALVPLPPLHAVAGEPIAAAEGVAVAFDGSGSTPANEITSYHWSFGDGSSAEGEDVSHAYAAPGKYEAELTVYRGSETSQSTVTVTVEAKASHLTTVSVLGEGKAVKGAEVTYIAPGGSRTEAVTDATGRATLAGLQTGEDSVYVYASGFLPKVASVGVSDGTGAVTVALTAGEAVASTVASKELTLAEIEKAGINPAEPGNQQVYSFEVKLAFINEAEPPAKLSCDENAEGEFVGKCSGEIVGGGGGTVSCSSSQCDLGGGIVVEPEVVEGHPLIQWLILRGKATVLKQFFEVSMVLQNLASEPFKLKAGTATITLPAGLSLAPTGTPQAATQSVPAIPGGGSETTNWIIRGDTPGEYNISTLYKSELEKVEAPVEVQASLGTPLKVWGVEALSLKVRADEGFLAEGRPYHVEVGVTNKANIALYNVGVAIDPAVHEEFDFQPDQQFTNQVSELKPGETVWTKQLILVPIEASESSFKPNLSSATFDGEEAKPGEGIEAVKPPALYAETAGSGPGLEITWQAVPGAEGYEVFSTPTLETPFAQSPDEVAASEGGTPVTEIPAGDTSAYILKDTEERRFYGVSTLVHGEPILDHPVIHAQVTVPQTAEYGQCVAQKKGEYTEADCKSKSAKAKKGKFEWKPGPAPSCVAQKKGEYTSSSCTTKSPKAKKGKYEKAPGPGYIATTGVVTLEVSGGARKVVCEASTASGEVTGSKTGVQRITFTGCESSGKDCQSEGPHSTPSDKPGVIVTNLLDTKLVDPAAGKVWTQLSSAEHEPYLLEFGCGGSELRMLGLLSGVQGGDINVSSLTSTTTFATGEGEQALYSELSENSGASWAGPDPTSALTTATNTAASKTEIKA